MRISTVKDRIEILYRGSDILASVLSPHGFQFKVVSSGSSCGGTFVCGEFVHGDRRLELHVRWSLGLVAYHMGRLMLMHDDYLRALLGRSHAGHYPSTSEDPLVGFDGLRQDLVEYCTDFICGTGEPVLSVCKSA